MSTVLITGSSRGIGKEIARKFLENNFNVVINCKNNISELNDTLEELKKISANVIALPCDVGDFQAVTNMFDSAEKYFGEIDILINNAAVSYFGLFNQMDYLDIQNLLSSNLMSVLNCTRLAIPSMIKNKRGCVINISSIWSISGASCEAVYSATKGAVDSFTKALAKEAGPSNVRVNSIACGVIDTDMNSRLTKEEKQEMIDNIPLSRFGKPEEIAELCYFLCSNKAEYINGEIIKIDGGFL